MKSDKRDVPFAEYSFQARMYAVLAAKQSYAQNQEAKEETTSSVPKF